VSARRVLVTPPNFDDEARAFLAAQGCEVVSPTRVDLEWAHDELAREVAACDAWIVGPGARVTGALVASAPRVKAYARRGVGYERLDVEAIARAGAVALIAAGGNEDSVADQVIGMMLALARRMREQHLAMLDGDWRIRVGGELFRGTVGIVGLGRAGRAVARRLKGFETRILAAAPRPDRDFARAEGIELVDLATLLRSSDFVTLHAPLNDATRHMVDAQALATMKPGAVLINAGRGGLVDDAALLEALHAAASTRQGLARTNMIAARCVVAVLDGTPPPEGCVVRDGRR